jgi:diguanylate cyclase (GGDEF)-like protein
VPAFWEADVVDEPAAERARGSRPRLATAMWRDGLLIGLAGLIVGCLVGYGIGIGALATRVAICWVLMASLHVTLAITAGRISRAPGATRATGRVWAALSLAGAAYAVGDVVQLVLIAVEPMSLEVALGGTAQSLSVIVGTAAVVVVMLTAPIGLVSRRERTRFWLDAGVVMAAATTFGAYVYVPDGGSTFSDVFLSMLVGPGVFLVGVFAVVRLVFSAQSPFSALAGVTLAAAAALEGAVQASSGLMIDAGRLSWQLGLSVIASALLLCSARIQQLQVRADPDALRPRLQRRFSRLPYVAIAATYLLLVWVLAEVGLNIHAWIVVGGAIASTALVIVRQLVAFADNTHLLDELDATVDELRQSLGERELLTAELRHQASHDPLTGLANRVMLGTRLQLALSAVGSVAGRRALMIVDLDDFKGVNDEFGHAAGDELLVVAARRLRNCVRGSDLVARVGGDEFAILLEDLPDGPDEIAERIVEAMAMPFTVSGRTALVSASVGVVVFDSVRRTAEQLLHDADTAMYTAKRAGKGDYRICA